MSELQSLGVFFFCSGDCCVVKCLTCLRITHIKNCENIKFIDPISVDVSDKSVVFQNRLDRITDIGCLANINKYVVPLIDREIGDVQEILSFLLQIKRNINTK